MPIAMKDRIKPLPQVWVEGRRVSEKVSPYTTGFCSAGMCEGTKPVSPSGRGLKTCEYITTCYCTCHGLLDMMFEASGMERTPQQNPLYVPDRLTAWMPTAEERIALANERKAPERQIIIQPSVLPDVLPPREIMQRSETPSGRRVRGGLEDEVRKITDMWTAIASAGKIDNCTPAWIADMIDAEYPPSTGAITAVLERWIIVGFATVEKKPTRFTGYTTAGISKGLQVLKVEFKNKKRMGAAAVQRQGR